MKSEVLTPIIRSYMGHLPSLSDHTYYHSPPFSLCSTQLTSLLFLEQVKLAPIIEPSCSLFPLQGTLFFPRLFTW